jgi:protein-S-isoprenylcysteine O-methyltransferase Ste14
VRIVLTPLSKRRQRVPFLGAAALLGSPIALLTTVLHIPLIDLFIRREERQLAKQFGEEWVRYQRRVPRWI